jgi:predicted CxxxxCH...CXXCH cytochrome family protein
VLIALLGVGACVSQRTRADDRPITFWVGEIEAVVAGACGGCHGGEAPAGGYQLTTYLGALGAGSDATANAIAGNPDSRLLAILVEPDDPIHGELADVAPVLARWVVDARLAYRDSDLHAAGLMNPADPDFHGGLIAARSWDFAGCARCHGEAFDGGASGASCRGCHAEGPTACVTCHGDGPTSGAHEAHRDGELERPAACDDCHVVPEAWDDEGHIVRAGAADPAPAEVVFGAAAARDVVPPRRRAPPSYDPATATCAAVYCHGGTLGDAAASFASPRWVGGDGQAACGGCHGTPPSGHLGDECQSCHPTAVAANGTLAARHLDGVLDVGNGGTGCSACHGDAVSSAPPADLSGGTSPELLGVGAHRSHVLGPGRIADPVTCGECHVVPSDFATVGHIDDGPAEVFPAAAGDLARRDGAAPTWDRATARCSATYCHGGGDALSLDLGPDRIPQPSWTAVGQGEAACGRCHGLPPADGAHPVATIAECTDCHPSVDGFGNILFTGPSGAEHTSHLDGIVDLR